MCNQTVIFLDGVSCVGKTTLAEKSVDFSKYVKMYPGFAKKNCDMHIQYLYDHTVTNDILNHLDDIYACNSRISIIDRSFFSTLAYDILFKYKGHEADPDAFRAATDEVFEDEIYCKMLSDTWQSWGSRLDKLYPDMNIMLLWVIPTNVKEVCENLKSRGSFENSFVMENYIQNQGYMFKKLRAVTGLGSILFVESYLTGEILVDYLESTKLGAMIHNAFQDPEVLRRFSITPL